MILAALALSNALHAAPCREGQSRAASICGTLTVFEDRAARAGRTIGIRFVLIKAKHASHGAIVFNPGGPGVSAAAMAGDFADAQDGAFAALRDGYDILLVDNRGTGGSAPQNCNFAPAAHPELYFRQNWPDEIVRACRARLAQHANLSLYGTSAAADDLDDVRAALGYPKLILYGGSYGTQFYLDYARRHPQHVESIVLEGVAPPHFYRIPLPMARGAQTSLENLERACRSDAVCSAHFPDFAAHFDALTQRFDRAPITVTIINTVTHRPQRVQMTKEVFVEAIRHELYFPGNAAYLPVTVERAYHGDYRPLSQMADQMAQLFTNLQADGLNLSVSCAEDLPFITQRAIARETAGTFEGDSRVRAQQRACRIWNVKPVAASFDEPVRSNAPILMISGSDDPATPPQYAREAMRYLPNARRMLVPGASHDSDFPPCVDKAIVAFVRARSAAGLNLSGCAAKYRRPAFATLAFDEAAPGGSAAQSKRFRGIIDDLMRGHLDASQMTPALAKEIGPAVGSFDEQLHEIGGELQAMTFKGIDRTKKTTVYRYLLRFTRSNASATFTLDNSNRISGMDVTPI